MYCKKLLYPLLQLSLSGLAMLTAAGCNDDTGNTGDGIEDDSLGECSDAADNDRDGLFDCKDPDCAQSAWCLGSGLNGPDTDNAHAQDTSSAGSGTGATGSAAEIAARLGRPAQFLIGLGSLGNDGSWATAPVHQLPVTLDLHYEYMVGLPGEGGWTEWNQDAMYPVYVAEADVSNGVIPMATVYQMAARGESNMAAVNDPDYMGPYWEAAKLLMERYGTGIGEHPAVVSLEPDFWGYTFWNTNGDPSTLPARLHSECAHLPADISGIGKCWIYLARTYAPNVVIGLHASEWGIDAKAMARFLLACGGEESDVVFREFLDRDAGCYESGDCDREGNFYMDETNQTSPNFREHLEWTRTLSMVMKKPVIWWQVPLGVPSDTPGGTPGHYRDNRVKYIFDHPDEFVDVGGLGVVFGPGAKGQTTLETDGGQFEAAVMKYYANPEPLL